MLMSVVSRRLRAALLSLALVVGGLSVPSMAPAQAQTPIPVLTDGVSLGRADAPVTLQVYLSFGCPHCRDWYNQVFPVLKQRYIDTGKVRLVVVEFTAGHHGLARAGAIAARCAGPDKYFAAAAALYSTPPKAMGEPGATDAYGQPLADTDAWTREALKAAGVSEARIKACDTAGQGAALDERMQRAMAEYPGYRGGTPAFVANGEPVEAGTLDWAEYAIAVTSKAAGRPLTTDKAYDLFCVGELRLPGALQSEPWETRWSFRGDQWRLAKAPATVSGTPVVESEAGVALSDGERSFLLGPDRIPRLAASIAGETFEGRCGVAPLTPFPK